jgi:hypothetical protein
MTAHHSQWVGPKGEHRRHATEAILQVYVPHGAAWGPHGVTFQVHQAGLGFGVGLQRCNVHSEGRLKLVHQAGLRFGVGLQRCNVHSEGRLKLVHQAGLRFGVGLQRCNVQCSAPHHLRGVSSAKGRKSGANGVSATLQVVRAQMQQPLVRRGAKAAPCLALGLQVVQGAPGGAAEQRMAHGERNAVGGARTSVSHAVELVRTLSCCRERPAVDGPSPALVPSALIASHSFSDKKSSN